MDDGVVRRPRGAIAWGFVSQGLSSATNFGLSMLAGRALGPDGLGRIFLGFATYLIVLGLQRALLVEPLVAASAAGDHEERARTASAALRISIGIALCSAVVVAAAGLLIEGPVGRGLLLIAPWLVPALLHDLWRWTLFRDHRARTAASVDVAWASTMILTVPIGRAIGTDWAVLGCWGVGAMAGATLGTLLVRPRRRAWLDALRWWRREVWPFGRWMAATQILTTALSNATAFIISVVVGTTALGGVRAAESIFAPLTLVIPALSMPGLPALARAAPLGRRAQNRIALMFSGVALACALLYLVVMVLGGIRLLPILFGRAFAPYTNLLWPFAAGQIAAAAGVGLSLLLKAGRRGPALLLGRGAGSAAECALVAPLSAAGGALGAAWAGAANPVMTTLTQAWAVSRRPSSTPQPTMHVAGQASHEHGVRQATP